MSKNHLSTNFKANPDKETWNNICPPMEYRLFTGLEANSLGIGLPMPNINSVIIAASGSVDSRIMYIVNYIRIDKTEIDQEPYIELYVSGSTKPCHHGIFHHADFNGRTEKIKEKEFQKIFASGSTADIQFLAKPDKNSGTLEELRMQGNKISGFDYAWERGNKLLE